jgi:hypothetical protein
MRRVIGPRRRRGTDGKGASTWSHENRTADIVERERKRLALVAAERMLAFEDFRSERQLIEVVPDLLCSRWHLGYNFDEPLPDHSNLTRNGGSRYFGRARFSFALNQDRCC